MVSGGGGVPTTWGSALKRHRIRKVENHRFRAIPRSAHTLFPPKRQASSRRLSAYMPYHIALPSQLCGLSYFASTGLIDFICKAETNHDSHFQDSCVSPESGQVTAGFVPAPGRSSSVHKINLFLGSFIPHLCLPHLLLSHLNTSQSYKRLVEARNSPVQCLSALSHHSNKIQFFFKVYFPQYDWA